MKIYWIMCNPNSKGIIQYFPRYIYNRQQWIAMKNIHKLLKYSLFFAIHGILFMIRMIVVYYSKSKIMNFSIRIQPGVLYIVQNRMGVTYEL